MIPKLSGRFLQGFSTMPRTPLLQPFASLARCPAMTMTLIVVAVVSGALILGAAWGAFGSLGNRVEGFLIALAGGALLLSVVSELIEPSIEKSSSSPR